MIKTFNIPTHPEAFIVQGDTIPKISITFDALTDIDLTTVQTIKMHLYNKFTKVFEASLNDGITVIDQKNLQIDEIPDNTLPVGESIGDLEIKDSEGKTKTYFRLKFKVQKQYTV